MESLSSSLSISISNLRETYPILNSHLPSSSFCLIKTPNQRIGSLKFNSETSQFHRFYLQALPREVPDEGEDQLQPLTLNNGFRLVSEDSQSVYQILVGYIKLLLWFSINGLSQVLKGDSNQSKSSEKDVDKLIKVELHGSGASGGSRAGLFRTPISGGVHSATSAHGLPRPALAVRNLMEQARFAHLCTVMSRMHHRREGYPFGSLVDFAPDSMGRNLQIPGWSGLSNARVTIFGDVYPLPEHEQEWAHKQYIAKHQQGPSQQWGNFYYFRMQNIRKLFDLNKVYPLISVSSARMIYNEQVELVEGNSRP
ncbi:hypothetical protein Goshw_030173 [Gossypium schwendimanii]|uniref:Uncharacterized protein n=1 Tax=Gossypium schwendimanii TaxID=34291 RepID=A0A7J9LCK2_GOSSC|nr:hypothetical protein [Gossypium schwendimanii]